MSGTFISREWMTAMKTRVCVLSSARRVAHWLLIKRCCWRSGWSRTQTADMKLRPLQWLNETSRNCKNKICKVAIYQSTNWHWTTVNTRWSILFTTCPPPSPHDIGRGSSGFSAAKHATKCQYTHFRLLWLTHTYAHI